ncbi:Regulator of sirC expression, contains transglutaminase-like and TPR domains [Actinacidiphila yanglinensis]|uniref:Regulator of sirC expression, contains transglutaminase-like and TPR domains n=1 Tax=Actinacidiphila yanglinensis TaxID=310779 RepID=A0A1H5V5G5_9ACTN|nr:transglutaminase-like domain-containing protein [Actinacidiphila yanglinensis]SEF82559.1 Regulator of sirC expression, contains transglutaminase-like and TPR domains [Actinacidiphila yanglinensis]
MTDSVRERFAAAAREERPDLAELCLLIGAEADPALDGPVADLAQIELDRLAGLIPYGPTTALEWAQALGRVLGAGHGFHGTAADYGLLSSSLLQEVLRRRRGLPILLSVVWIEVARRAGAKVHGVGLPGHFVVALGDVEADGGEFGADPAPYVLVDPFDGGRVLSGPDAEHLMSGPGSGAQPGSGPGRLPGAPVPADTLDIVRRVLNNIRAWAAPRPERLAVQLWTLDLTLLLPRHPAKLRYERAQVLVQMGDFLGGAAEMEEYAEVIGSFDPETAAAIRSKARAARALLN